MLPWRNWTSLGLTSRPRVNAQVNINCAFGTFHPRTVTRLMQPLFEDLCSLCILPSAPSAPQPRAGRWLRVREAGIEGSADDVANKELQEHQMYLAFKKSGRKKYERQFTARDFVLSDVAREETPREVGKCQRCGCFECRCAIAKK